MAAHVIIILPRGTTRASRLLVRRIGKAAVLWRRVLRDWKNQLGPGSSEGIDRAVVAFNFESVERGSPSSTLEPGVQDVIASAGLRVRTEVATTAMLSVLPEVRYLQTLFSVLIGSSSYLIVPLEAARPDVARWWRITESVQLAAGRRRRRSGGRQGLWKVTVTAGVLASATRRRNNHAGVREGRRGQGRREARRVALETGGTRRRGGA